MRKLIVNAQISLDGVMQGPGGPEEDPRDNFTLGGWAMPFGDEAIGRALHETATAEHDLLFGRRTYDIFASYWPKQGDNPVTNGFNRAVKYVITHRPERLDWPTSKAIGGDFVRGVRELKATDGRELQMWGSHEVLQQLIGAELIDEYRLWIAPVVLGQGRRLFEAGAPAESLELVKSTVSSKGVMLNTYRPAGAVEVTTVRASEVGSKR
jgi:dihydrofolate reductase